MLIKSHTIDLDLVTVCCVRIYMWRWDKTRIQAVYIGPTAGPSAWFLHNWDLTSADLNQWLYDNAWDSPGPIASILTFKVGLRAVLTTVHFVTLHNGGRDTIEYNHRLISPAEGNSVVSLPLDMLQSHLPHIIDQNHSSEADLGASTPRTKEQTPFLTRQWQLQTKGFCFSSISRAGSEKQKTNQIPYQGDAAQASEPNSTPQRANTRRKTNWSCSKKIKTQ